MLHVQCVHHQNAAKMYNTLQKLEKIAPLISQLQKAAGNNNVLIGGSTVLKFAGLIERDIEDVDVVINYITEDLVTLLKSWMPNEVSKHGYEDIHINLADLSIEKVKLVVQNRKEIENYKALNWKFKFGNNIPLNIFLPIKFSDEFSHRPYYKLTKEISVKMGDVLGVINARAEYMKDAVDRRSINSKYINDFHSIMSALTKLFYAPVKKVSSGNSDPFLFI